MIAIYNFAKVVGEAHLKFLTGTVAIYIPWDTCSAACRLPCGGPHKPRPAVAESGAGDCAVLPTGRGKPKQAHSGRATGTWWPRVNGSGLQRQAQGA